MPAELSEAKPRPPSLTGRAYFAGPADQAPAAADRDHWCVRIDDATDGDAQAIAGIYNQVVVSSTAVFSDRQVTVEERLRWMRQRRNDGFPVLVARDDDGRVVAFASFGWFRAWPGYRTTVEHSVHVAADYRRRGIGRQLVQALIERARASGRHVVVAGLDADNLASRRLHEALGFHEVARMPQVARKFDRWIDLLLLQLTLDGPDG
jgi:phosphinothricin acetyltransferase